MLLIKTSSLGDVVHALPAVTDAYDRGIEIDWVVEEGFADIPKLHPGVSTVIPVAWRRWRSSLTGAREEMRDFLTSLRANEYDLVLDSQGLVKSSLLATMARGRSAGYSHTSAREPWASFLYGDRCRVAKGGHAIERQRALFAAALGYEHDEVWSSGIERTAPENAQVFLLHGTTWQTKHWPEIMWIELVRKIRAHGKEPLVTWGNEAERDRAIKLASEGAVLVERRPLGELIEVLAECSTVITVDSGLGHLAAALGLRTIGLYAATSGDLTGCRGHRADYLQGQAHCAPCVRKSCTQYKGPELTWGNMVVDPPCFASVKPDSVFELSFGR